MSVLSPSNRLTFLLQLAYDPDHSEPRPSGSDAPAAAKICRQPAEPTAEVSPQRGRSSLIASPDRIMPRHSNPPRIRLDSRLAILLLLPTSALLAQPSLRVTSPSDRTVVYPGESINVTVEASGKVIDVAIFGCNPIGASAMLASPPYAWTVQVPKNTRPGPCALTAHGSGGIPPRDTRTEAVTLQVELPEDAAIVRLDAQFPLLEFHRGDVLNLTVDGVFPDGGRVDLERSMHTSFKSSAPDVVTVDSRGVVEAIAPGSARITITYRDLHIDIPVTVLPTHP
jgi:hypothetical protein